MTLAELFDEQYKQQLVLAGELPKDRTERKLLAQRFATYAIEEIINYLEGASYKHFVPVDEMPRASRIIELVDAFKYILAICYTEGISAAEFEAAFKEKTQVVYQRFANKEIGSSKPVCGIDIDGVLAKKIPGYNSTDSEDKKNQLFEEGVALKLEVVPEAKETLDELRYRGWAIVLVTSRKFQRHQKLEHETYEWLRRNQLPFDRLLCSYDKSEAMAKSGLLFRWHIEDSVKHAVDIANNGTKVFLIGHPEIDHPRIVNINSIKEVLQYVRQI